MTRALTWSRRYGPAVVLIAIIFAASSIPSRELPSFGSWDAFAKKGAHALGYGLLGISFLHGLQWKWRRWWAALLLAAAYSVTDELHQFFVPGRHPSPIDVCIDVAGCLAGLCACSVVRFARRRRAKRVPGTP